MQDNRSARILVIDDEALLRKTVSDYLEDIGHTVFEAPNGREGLEVFAREQPDAVLVDLRMPELDGLQVLASIRESAPETPVIVVSGVGVMQDVIEALRLGAWDYLRKPVEDMNLLGHALDKSLERARLLRENRLYRDHLEEQVMLRTADLKAANERLRRFENIVSVTDDLLAFIGRDGVYQAVNQTFLDVFRVERDDVIGRSFGSFLTSPHFREEIKTLFERCLEGEKGSYSSWLPIPDRGNCYLDVRMFPYFDDDQHVSGVVLYVRDMTDRKQTEDKLRESQRTAEALINAPQDPAFLLDAGGVILGANEVAARRFRSTVDGLIGRSLFEFLPEDIARERRTHLREVVETGVPRRFRDDQAGRYMDNSLYPLFGDLGRVERVALYSKDVTDQMLAERETEARKQQLLQADKMTSLGILVSGVAHEINNPTGIITLNAPLLREIWQGLLPTLDHCNSDCNGLEVAGLPYEELRERVPFFLDQIAESAERIRRIVAELKDFARQDPRESMTDVDLNQVVARAVGLTANKLKKSTHHFEVIYDSAPVMVCGNFQRLEQVLVNGIINACEALRRPEESIRIRVERDAQRKSGQVLIRDEGMGIAREDMKHLFDPFFTTKRDSGGTGLGLSVSMGIIKDHGGNLEFESEQGHGALMRVSLPLLSSED